MDPGSVIAVFGFAARTKAVAGRIQTLAQLNPETLRECAGMSLEAAAQLSSTWQTASSLNPWGSSQ